MSSRIHAVLVILVVLPVSCGSCRDRGKDAAGKAPVDWQKEYTPDEDTIALGKVKFETYCAPCHGYAGEGDGMVHQRAEQLGAERHLGCRQLLDQLVRSGGVWRSPRLHCIHEQLTELPRSGRRRRREVVRLAA